jgi:hypothetical protein
MFRCFRLPARLALVAMMAVSFLVAGVAASQAAGKKPAHKPQPKAQLVETSSCVPAPQVETRDGSRFARFTAPNGCQVWVNAAQIIAAYRPAPLESKPNGTKPRGTKSGGGGPAMTQIRLPFGVYFLQETPGEVAERMPEKRRLTLVDGSDLWINPDEVFAVSHVAAGLSTRAGKTTIRVHETEFFVREMPWEVAAILEKVDSAADKPAH